MKKSFAFPSHERLKSRKVIDSLFQDGNSFAKFPLRIVYKHSTTCAPNIGGIQMAFSVPKKKIKSAVMRNRVKRLMREAYRLQIDELRKICAEKEIALQAMLIFTASDLPEYAQIQESAAKIWKKLAETIQTNMK